MAVEDRRKASTRLTGLQVSVGAVFAILAVSFWVLQVVQHQQFNEMAENNHQRTLALRAPRGLIFDREGRVMVENRNSYSISIVREHTKNLPRTIKLLAQVLGIEESAVKTVVDRHRRSPLTGRLSSSRRLARAGGGGHRAAADFELPDVVVEQCRRAVIRTRWGPICSIRGRSQRHAGGRERRAEERDLTGQSGIERVYNQYLIGDDGAKRVVVNSVGREIRRLRKCSRRKASGCS
jgi:penicillin-binding protein 2